MAISKKLLLLHIGTNIKAIREMLGMSREALAFELNSSIIAIEKLEQRKRVSKQVIVKVARIFRMEPEMIHNFNAAKQIKHRPKKG